MPDERHDHYSPNGTLIGYTIVSREPEFTDRDRDRLTALAQVKANECPKCGGPLDKTTDPEHYAWHVTHDTCQRCETVAYHQAKTDGASKEDALKHARSAGRLWKAAEAPPGEVL